jgi:CheY-like chemotaxis protein
MNAHVLVVDDDELVRTGLAEDLRREGYRVTAAASGREALEILGQTAVDLVLTDLVMQEPDGMELLRRLSEQSPDLPVVVLTGHGTVASAIEAIRHGAADYLLKPARPEEIAHRIQRVLETRDMRRRLLRERAHVQEQRQRFGARAEQRARFAAIQRFAAGLAADLRAALQETREGGEPPRPASTGLEELARHLARLEGTGGSDETTVPLDETVRAHVESEEFLSLLDAHPQVRFEYRPAAPPLAAVCGQETARALAAVLDSAVRATTGKRRVVAGTAVERATRPDGTPGLFAVFTVRFHAALKPEDAEHLFEPYYAQRELGWSGVGAFDFAEACALVHHSEGYSDARVTEGGEAVEMVFLLPTAGKIDEDTARPRFRSRGGERILVVDDSEAHRDEARRLLEELGYEVALAENGAAAANWVEQRLRSGEPPPDLAIIDLVLGDVLDGVDVFHRLRQIHPRQKAVLVGGFVETDRVREALDEGVFAYLRKPLTIETLGRTVREALDQA